MKLDQVQNKLKVTDQQKAFPSVPQPPGNSKHIHVLHELQDEGQWNSLFIFFPILIHAESEAQETNMPGG